MPTRISRYVRAAISLVAGALPTSSHRQNRFFWSLSDRVGIADDAQHENVILLAEGFGGSGDFGGGDGLLQHGVDPIEAEEPAVLVLRLDYAIGHQEQRVSGRKLEMHDGKLCGRSHAQRQCAFHRQFFSVEIRR